MVMVVRCRWVLISKIACSGRQEISSERERANLLSGRVELHAGEQTQIVRRAKT
jgi:hypothetical protein